MELYELFPYWKTRTDRIRKSLEILTPFQLEFRHRSDMRSMGNLYRHIIAAEIYWIQDVVGGQNKGYFEIEDSALPNSKSMLDKWEEVRSKTIELVLPYSANDLQKKFTNFRKKEFDLNYILWHVWEHEIHHSGQISQMLRVQKLPSPIN